MTISIIITICFVYYMGLLFAIDRLAHVTTKKEFIKEIVIIILWPIGIPIDKFLDYYNRLR
jgi:hypothetical protein